MIICLCHRLSDRDIERAAQEGIESFEELQDETCIARNCACCEEYARAIFEAAQQQACGSAGRSGSARAFRIAAVA